MWWGKKSNLAGYLSGSPVTFPQGENAAVYIGHSTVLVHLDEQNLITDPFYLDRLYILKRHQPPGVPLQDLPVLHAILISHGHLDHMDLGTLAFFPREIPVILPAKLEEYAQELGFRDIRPLTWGERTVIGPLSIQALPVRHFLGRSLYETRSIPQSYLIQGKKNVFFCGDSALMPEFEEIGRSCSLDLALLPIGHYRPACFRRMHMSPEDALEAMAMLRARRMMPIHWGAFRLSLEPVEEPPRRFVELLHERRINPRARLVHPGQKLLF